MLRQALRIGIVEDCSARKYLIGIQRAAEPISQFHCCQGVHPQVEEACRRIRWQIKPQDCLQFLSQVRHQEGLALGQRHLPQLVHKATRGCGSPGGPSGRQRQ